MTGAVEALTFPVAVPTLSRGVIDRSGELDPPAIVARWPAAAVLVVDADGRAELGVGGVLAWRPGGDLAETPPDGSVWLGQRQGRDHWAVPGPVAGGANLRAVGAALPDDEAALFTTAVATLTWHAHGAYCPLCGEPSRPAPTGWSRTCPRGHQEFPRTDPAVIVLVHDGAGSMVLARQPVWPAGRYSVLAGFVEAGESLEATVRREIAEEVGLTLGEVGYLASQPWPFPRSLMLGFAALAPVAAPMVCADGEIEEAGWFSRRQVREMLTAEAAGDPPRHGVNLPPAVSIARRMIEGWAAR